MSADEYYNHTTFPAFKSLGSSASMRAELEAIEAGFGKLPDMAANPGRLVAVNVLGTKLEALAALPDNTLYNVSTLAHGFVPKAPGSTLLFLRGDGTWAAQGNSVMPVVARTSNTQITTNNVASLINYTGSTNFVQTFASVASLGTGWWCYLQNLGTADVELEAPASVTTTSTTSNSIAAGTNWIVATGLSIATGDAVIVRRTSDPANQSVVGTVTSYTSGTGVLVVNVTARIGSGTFTDWTVTTRPATLTIDGLPRFVMYPNEARMIYVDETGTVLKSLVIRAFYRRALTSFSFIVPPGYSITEFDGVGGAGGAGSGRKGASGSNKQGGSPGGTPGRVRRQFSGLTPGSIFAISVGAAGTSGAAQTVNDTNGNNGTAGGNTSFGTLAIAYGGVAGIGGASDATTNLYGRVAGSGSLSAAAAAAYGTNNASALGGSPNVGFITNAFGDAVGEGGATAQNINSPGNSVFGGASSISGSTETTTVKYGGNSMYGVAGGGFGAWITSGSAVPATGCHAGVTGSWANGSYGTGAQGGTSGAVATNGANGAPNAGTDFDMGNSGAGGGSCTSASASAGAGGNGTFPGGAGGGGGAATNGTGSSGAGGISQPGRALIWGVI
jgi:hypothetical protein